MWNCIAATKSGVHFGTSDIIHQMKLRERRHHRVDAFDREIRAQLVDRRELRLHVGPELLLTLGHGDELVTIARRRDGMSRIGRRDAPCIRIEREELEQDGRARAALARHDDGGHDLLVEDLRILVELARHEEPRTQRAQDLLARHQAADDVLLRAALDLGHEGIEAPPPIAVETSEVAEPGRRLREADELVDVEGDELLCPAHGITHRVHAAHPIRSRVALRHRLQHGDSSFGGLLRTDGTRAFSRKIPDKGSLTPGWMRKAAAPTASYGRRHQGGEHAIRQPCDPGSRGRDSDRAGPDGLDRALAAGLGRLPRGGTRHHRDLFRGARRRAPTRSAR